MNIGKAIRKIRREREMTQQQLADALGLSVSAVSQWEMGKTMPDITILPQLSAIFGVSTDELLGVDQEQVEHLVRRRTQTAERCHKNGDFEGMLRIAEQTYREYPNHLSAIGMYAWVLQTTGSAEHTDRWERSIRLSQKILDRSVNDGQRVASIARMCRCYAKLGDKANCLKCARLLPDSPTMTTHYVIQAYDLLPTEQRVEAYPRQIASLGSMLNRYGRDVAASAGLQDAQKREVVKTLQKLKNNIMEILRDLPEEKDYEQT